MFKKGECVTENERKILKVDQFITELSEPNKTIAKALRELIFEASPDLVEEFKWSMPNYSYQGLVCFIQVSKQHTSLGFHRGNELAAFDSEHLLQGEAKTMRHIRIKNVEEIQPEAIKVLIQQAVALN